MATLKKIKSLRTSNFNVVDVVSSFILSNLNLKEYDTTKAYVLDDKIIRANATTGKYEILRCIAATTGVFTPTKWTLDNVHDSIQNSTFIETITVYSATQPTQPTNQVWFQTLQEKSQIDPSTF